MNKHSITYPFKVWLATIIASPIILFMGMVALNALSFINGLSSNESGLQLLYIASAILSLPSLIVYYIFYLALPKNDLPIIQIKFYSCLTAILGLFFTLSVISKQYLFYFIPYAIAIILFSSIFKVGDES